jgi:hypothetical protein
LKGNSEITSWDVMVFVVWLFSLINLKHRICDRHHSGAGLVVSCFVWLVYWIALQFEGYAKSSFLRSIIRFNYRIIRQMLSNLTLLVGNLFLGPLQQEFMPIEMPLQRNLSQTRLRKVEMFHLLQSAFWVPHPSSQT